MEIFKIYLDGKTTAQNDVPSLKGFTEVLERDYDLRGIVFKYPNGITIFGDTYAYMLKKYRDNGFCGEVSLTIERLNGAGSDQTLKGIVFLSDIKWNWDQTTATITIEDDNYGARISNNLNTAVNLLTQKTKNNLDIDTIAFIKVIETYDPAATLATFASTCKGVDAIDAFNTIILFITDNIVSFDSEFLRDDTARILITTGLSLRTTDADVLELSFNDLLNAIAKPYNLWWYIEDNQDGTYIMRLEPENTVFNTDELLRMDYVAGIEQTTFEQMLYSGVVVGCNAKRELGTGVTSLDYYRALTHTKEEYFLTGTCNIDNQLDLFNPFVYDSNAIEDAAINLNDDWDNDIFLIEYDDGTLKAGKYKYASNTGTAAAPYYYNFNLLNVEVLKRYEYPNDLSQSVGDEDDFINIELSADSATFGATTIVYPVLFDNEITDVNNNYNPATGRFTAPDNGTYTFEINIPVALTTVTQNGDGLEILASIVLRDNTATIYDSQLFEPATIYGLNETQKTEVYNYSKQLTTYMEKNDTLDVSFKFTIKPLNVGNVIRFNYFKESQLKTTAVENGGGVYINGDVSTYKAVLLDYPGAINDEAWNAIRSDKKGKFTITRDGKTTMDAWIKTIERDFLTTQCTFSLVTNLNQTNKIGV